MNKPQWNLLTKLVTTGALGLQLYGCAPDGRTDARTTTVALVSRTAGDSSDSTATRTRAAPPDGVKTPTPTGVTTAAPSPPPSPSPPPIAPPPTTPVAQAVESGTGWQHVRVGGTGYDTQQAAVVALSGEYYIINGRDAIASTPLPDTVRSKLSDKMNNTPRPAAGDEEIIIVPTGIIDAAAQAGVAQFSVCDDKNNQTYPVSYAFDETYPYHVDTQDAFSGSGDFSVHLRGGVTGTVTYDVQFHWCIPTVVLHRVSVAGNADVIADATIDASFGDNGKWSAKVAEPVLGTVLIPYVEIPITFSVPITIGIDADAKAELHSHATYEANGQFNISCNAGGCDGTKSATSGFTPKGSPTIGVTGTAHVTPWAQATIHAKILDDWLAYAAVGVKTRMPGELWAYAGNTCGDANNLGTPQFVSATTMDLGIAIDVVADTGFFGSDLGPWSWNVWTRHLAFWSLGDTSALSPIFYPTWPTSDALMTARMHARMRPCWPYTDAVTYQVTWNDGATALFTGAPGTLVDMDHPYASYGAKIIDIVSLYDEAGRSLGGTTESSAMLSPIDYGMVTHSGDTYYAP